MHTPVLYATNISILLLKIALENYKKSNFAQKAGNAIKRYKQYFPPGSGSVDTYEYIHGYTHRNIQLSAYPRVHTVTKVV